MSRGLLGRSLPRGLSRDAMVAWLREMLRNPHYKLLALALALVAWTYVQGDEVHETRIKADVLWSLPPSLTTPELLPSSVTLTVRGTRAATRRAKDADVDLPVDVSDIGVGDHSLAFADFAPRNLPAGIEVLSASPASVRFMLDEITSRKVSVQPVLVGEPPDAWVIGSVALAPQVVEVSGPRVLVERLREVDTRPIDVSGITDNTDIEVDLDLPRSLRVVDPSERPTAHVTVLPRIAQRELVVPVVVWGSDAWIPEPDSLRVTLRGPSAALVGIDAEEVIAVAHLPADTERTRYEAPFGPTEGARLRILFPGPRTIEVERVDPPRIEVVRR